MSLQPPARPCDAQYHIKCSFIPQTNNNNSHGNSEAAGLHSPVRTVSSRLWLICLFLGKKAAKTVISEGGWFLSTATFA